MRGAVLALGILWALAVVVTVVGASLTMIRQRRQRLAHWTAKAEVDYDHTEVQIQLAYFTAKQRRLVLERQVVAVIPATADDYEPRLTEAMASALRRAWELEIDHPR